MNFDFQNIHFISQWYGVQEITNQGKYEIFKNWFIKNSTDLHFNKFSSSHLCIFMYKCFTQTHINILNVFSQKISSMCKSRVLKSILNMYKPASHPMTAIFVFYADTLTACHKIFYSTNWK